MSVRDLTQSIILSV